MITLNCIDDDNRCGWSVFLFLLGSTFIIVGFFIFGRGLREDINYLFFFILGGVIILVGSLSIGMCIIISKLQICNNYLREIKENTQKEKFDKVMNTNFKE